MIELLVVVSIIVLLATLSMGAYFRMIENGHVEATKALTQQLNSALQERLESFYFETKAMTPRLDQIQFGDPAVPGVPTWGVNTIQYRRAIILARLEAMRGDFPQQFIDFMRIGDTGGGSNPAGLGQNNASRPARTAIYQEYLKRTVSAASTPDTQVSTALPYATATSYSSSPNNHQAATESAECLYLLLGVKSEGMSFSVDQIPQRFIADTDNDGLLEFVDSWGRPLRFYRWPTDYYAYLLDVTGQMPSQLTVNALDPESFLLEPTWFASDKRKTAAGFEQIGYFRLHQAYPSPVPDPLPAPEPTGGSGLGTNGEWTPRIDHPRSYPLLPLIVSAGSDAEFGLMWPTTGVPTVAQMHFRGARIDTSAESAVRDNILSIQLSEAPRK